jgi:hypothetical protein
MAIPIYLKTDPDMPRPADSEFYLISADGAFLGRNHAFFVADVPVRGFPRGLQPHSAFCRVRFPRLGRAALEYIVGFFDRVYQLYGAEALVLLLWNQRRKRYKVWVPRQEATVWESLNGVRTALDVTYELPVPFPKDHVLVADIHSHCDFAAGASATDKFDERFRDGVHAIVGRIDEREPPEFRVEISIAGSRFQMRFDQMFRGYQRRRHRVPAQWMEAVHVKVKRPQPYVQPSASQKYGYRSSTSRD